MHRTPEDIADELLVLKCQAGDDGALKALVLRWQPRLVRLAWRLTGHGEAARDLTQDAWLAIVRGIRGLDDAARFRTWACRIVANKCADWIRRRGVQRAAVNDLRQSTPHSSTKADAEATKQVQLSAALRQLPAEQRVVLALHYLDGFGISEIAEVLDLLPGTVKSRLHHARRSLKEVIERIES